MPPSIFLDTDNACGDYGTFPTPPCNVFTWDRFFITYYDFDESTTLQARSEHVTWRT